MTAAHQLTLTAYEPAPAPLTLAERFEAFDRENPQVWAAFEGFALEAVRVGRTRIGAKALWERMRWWARVEMQAAEGEYRLNNSWTSFYARKWQRQHPEHAGLFETRGGE